MDKAKEFIKENDIEIGEDAEGKITMLTDDEYLLQGVAILLRDYAQQVSRERDIQWMRHLLKWGDKPAKFCPVLPKNKSNQEDK